MARFLSARVAEAVEALWAALQAGEFIADAAVRAGTCGEQGTRWVAAWGGVRPRRGRDLRGRCLSFAEREEIALARARGETMRPSRGAWAGRRRRSRASYAATPTAVVATGRPPRRRWPMSAPVAPSRPSRPPTRGCLRSWRTIWGGASRPSRSPGGCVAGSPMTRRCGCRPRRSTSRCTCSPAARWRASDFLCKRLLLAD
jgi:hypothetical protein